MASQQPATAAGEVVALRAKLQRLSAVCAGQDLGARATIICVALADRQDGPTPSLAFLSSLFDVCVACLRPSAPDAAAAGGSGSGGSGDGDDPVRMGWRISLCVHARRQSSEGLARG